MLVSPNPLINQKPDSSLNFWLSEQGMFISRLRDQDTSAFKFLYKQYSAALYGAIISRVSDREKAKLILECTFCEVWHSFSKYNETKIRIFTWIYQIALQKIKEMA